MMGNKPIVTVGGHCSVYYLVVSLEVNYPAWGIAFICFSTQGGFFAKHLMTTHVMFWKASL